MKKAANDPRGRRSDTASRRAPLARALLWTLALWLAALDAAWLLDLSIWPAGLLRVAAILAFIPLSRIGPG